MLRQVLSSTADIQKDAAVNVVEHGNLHACIRFLAGVHRSIADLWMTPSEWQCATTLTMVRIKFAASFSLHACIWTFETNCATIGMPYRCASNLPAFEKPGRIKT